MRFPSLVRLGLLPLVLFSLTACNTFDRRARQKSSVFQALDPATQARLKVRQIQVGDTQDMVYIALGAPDERREQLDSGGKSSTWIYSAYWQEYQGTRMVGYQRQVIYDPASKSYRVYHEPDYQPIYAPRMEDRLRITFQDGHVTVIEQAQSQKSASGSPVKN
jgi:outer membrane protein assembly factor BamE (lipoprotein component of BamABCDE complex)